MADPRFFANKGPFTAAQLAQHTGASLSNPALAEMVFNDVAPLDTAQAKHVSFFDNVKYKEQFTCSLAGAAFVSPKMLELAPKGMLCLVSPQPYKAYAKAAQLFYPDIKPEAAIEEGAYVDSSAQLGADCTIETGVVIGAGAILGERCWVEANAVIGSNVVIGDDCRIGAGATVSHAIIGHHVRLYPGVRVGQDGFGFAIDPTGHVKVPQLGRVLIEDGVEIGANSCIDRGAGPDTVIGQGTWIDSLVQIGHNVQIGRGCVMASQVGISGSTVLEDFVALGGQVGLAGHIRIGKGARVAAQSGVLKNIDAGQEYMGYPAIPIKSFLRITAMLHKMLKPSKNS